MALAITDHVRKSPCVAAVGITFDQSCWATEVTRLSSFSRSTAVCMHMHSNFANAMHAPAAPSLNVQPG